MLINTRPLTAIGIALPFAVGGALLALRNVARALKGIRLNLILWRVAAALLLATGLTSLMTPIFNYAATGDPTANLYRLVWDYDRLGFCDECGRSGHTPEKAIRNLRLDLARWSSDLFGWTMPESLHNTLTENAGWWLGNGLSWILLPLGLVIGRRDRWTWLLMGTFAGLVGVHLLYWIGAQVYSARYYFEALPALALISAIPVTALARKVGRGAVYVVFALMIAASLIAYTPDRLRALWRFNNVGQDKIEALESLRDGRPVVIIVTGAERRSWRDWGTYMALTSPYLDSDIVAARDHGWERSQILARFPERQVIYLTPENVLLLGE